MKFSKLYTVGDGYCYNHHWPMWSELLSNILDIPLVNLAGIGAGNEYIANSIIDALEKEPNPKDCLWLIQWSHPKRLDLQIDASNQEIVNTIKTDTVYYKNFYKTLKDQTYWLSSASKLEIVNRHNDLLTMNQHNVRSRNWQLATAHALIHYGVEWRYLFTYWASWAKNNLIDDSRYIWMDQQQFRHSSKYKDLDINEIQPISSIHLDFLEQYILPFYKYDPARLEKIKQDTLLVDTNRFNQHKGSTQNQ